jgi:hypothetical protein
MPKKPRLTTYQNAASGKDARNDGKRDVTWIGAWRNENWKSQGAANLNIVHHDSKWWLTWAGVLSVGQKQAYSDTVPLSPEGTEEICAPPGTAMLWAGHLGRRVLMRFVPDAEDGDNWVTRSVAICILFTSGMGGAGRSMHIFALLFTQKHCSGLTAWWSIPL